MFPPDAEAMFRQAAEDMGTMDYTPYLLLRGWNYLYNAGQPGLDYMEDPDGGDSILNSIGVSRQLIRDGVEQPDPYGFMQNARYVARLPEPVLSEVKAFRARQTEQGLDYNRMPEPELEITTQPINIPEPVPDYYTPPEPASPLDTVDEIILAQAETGTMSINGEPPIPVLRPVLRVRRNRQPPKAESKPEPVPESSSPLARRFNFGDRE